MARLVGGNEMADVHRVERATEDPHPFGSSPHIESREH